MPNLSCQQINKFREVQNFSFMHFAWHISSLFCLPVGVYLVSRFIITAWKTGRGTFWHWRVSCSEFHAMRSDGPEPHVSGTCNAKKIDFFYTCATWESVPALRVELWRVVVCLGIL